VDGEVRDFNLRDPGHVSMYVCGPTVDNLPHLGHGRFTLVWDIARRWFTFRGLDVNYVSNITDIEDKIIARSLQEGRSTAEVVATYEACGGRRWTNSASRDRTRRRTPRTGSPDDRADQRFSRERHRLRHQ